MKQGRLHIFFSGSLIFSSAICYLFKILIFHYSQDTLFNFFQDLSFILFQVLSVIFILEKILQKTERESLIKKLNRAAAVLYSEMGNGLICINALTDNADNIKKK